MNPAYKLSDDAKTYLTKYYEILDTMIKEMTTVPLGESISYNFIVQMIPHHRAAIRMSRNLLQYSAWKPLRSIASGIITEQTQSIRDMEALLPAVLQTASCPCDLKLYQRRVSQITETMFADMNRAQASNHINADFMREMIPHHRGAVEMSENALQYRILPGLYPILEAIIASQKKGICQMERLLTCDTARCD